MDLNVSEIQNNALNDSNIKEQWKYLSIGSIRVDASIFDFSNTKSYQTSPNSYKISLKDGTVVEAQKQLENAYITALDDGTIEFYGFNSKNTLTGITGTEKNDKYSFVNCSNVEINPKEGSDNIDIRNSKKMLIMLDNDKDKTRDIDKVSFDDDSECNILGYNSQMSQVSHRDNITEFIFIR